MSIRWKSLLRAEYSKEVECTWTWEPRWSLHYSTWLMRGEWGHQYPKWVLERFRKVTKLSLSSLGYYCRTIYIATWVCYMIKLVSIESMKYTIKVNCALKLAFYTLHFFQAQSGWCEERACHSTETLLRRETCILSLMFSSLTTTGSAPRNLRYDILHLSSLTVFQVILFGFSLWRYKHSEQLLAGSCASYPCFLWYWQ